MCRSFSTFSHSSGAKQAVRPEILFDLFKPVTTLPGVGARIGASIAAATGGDRLVDLLWHLPNDIIDRRYEPSIEDAAPGSIATMSVTVVRHDKAPNKRAPYRVICEDGTGRITLVFFHAREDYLKRVLPEGEERLISGKVELFDKTVQMTHPDYILPPGELDTLKRVEPVYGLSAGVSLKVINKAVTAALEIVPELPEWLDNSHAAREQWNSWHESIRVAHNPSDDGALSPRSAARERLAYDELLANQLALAVIRRSARKLKGRRISGDGKLRNKALAALPYTLTKSQQLALAEINDDMAHEDRMLRLLQGDVGSGKTVVALLAMLNATEAGHQCAIMAPTEILARQHAATITSIADQIGVSVRLLTGRDKGKARSTLLDEIADGKVKIIIGTHALFQEDVVFADLGFAVIDEQHKFGVHQRLALAEKGKGVDILVMTATPIPRTLVLTAYGDMEASRLTEKPAGRKPVDTRAMPTERLDEIYAGIKRSTRDGARVYWVCPLVEESEKLDVAAAEDRYRHLQQVFGAETVGLAHGRMKGEEKDAVMQAFKEGRTKVLVATTVIEVGVDVPEATIMVIEHAERFGLAQLHQLRGRIGRSDRESTCLLVYGQPLTETAKKRIRIMRETEDGFRIAEEDLTLRGAGELLGTRQSGLPEFRVADLSVHGDLLATARRDAQLILETDPDLDTERGQALRVLLYLFERDEAIRNLRSG